MFSSSQSSCLDNQPPSSAELFETGGGGVSLPGFQYSVTEQCQLSLGGNASSCSSAAKVTTSGNNTGGGDMQRYVDFA